MPKHRREAPTSWRTGFTHRAVSNKRAKRAATGILDQILYSLTNFFLTLLIARHASAHAFGAYSVLLATYLIASAVNRGIASEPLIVRYSNVDRDTWEAAARRGLTHAFIFGLVAACFLFVISLPFGDDYLAMVSIFAVGMPFLFVQDYLRYAALAVRRPNLALANDGAVAVVQVGISIGLLANGTSSAYFYLATWVLAGTIGGGIGLAALRILPAGRAALPLRPQRDLAARFGLDNFITLLTQQGAGYLVALLAGLSAAGGFRAAQTVFTPPAILMLGVQLAVTPELVRIRVGSVVAMRRAVFFIALCLFLVSTVFYVLVLALPETIGVHAFGQSWIIGKKILPFLGVGTIAGGVTNAAVAGLRALEDGRRTLQARYVAIFLAVIAITPGTLLDGARGAAIAIAVSTPIQAAIWWWRLAASINGTAPVSHPLSIRRRSSELRS